MEQMSKSKQRNVIRNASGWLVMGPANPSNNLAELMTMQQQIALKDAALKMLHPLCLLGRRDIADVHNMEAITQVQRHYAGERRRKAVPFPF